MGDIKENELTPKMENMLKEIEAEKDKHLENVKRARQIKITAANFVGVNWVTDLLIQGAKIPLQQEDLYTLPDANQSKTLKSVLDPYWTSFHSNGSVSVGSVLAKRFGLRIILYIIIQGISVASALVIPNFLRDVIFYLQPGFPVETLRVPNGYAMAFIIFGLQVLGTLCSVTAQQLGFVLQLDFKTVLLSAVYEKAMRLSQQSSREFTEGQILNIINVDVEKISSVFMQLAQLITAPVQVVVSIILLGNLIGYAVWGGAGTLFAILLLQGGVIGLLVKYQRGFLQYGDSRLKLLREVLYGIKIIKFRALEEFFTEKITNIRLSQMQVLKKYYMIQVYFVGMIQIAPISMPIIAFLVYASINGSDAVTPQVIFPALNLFQGLFAPILIIPQAVTALIVAIVSWKRVVALLAAGETDVLSTKDDKNSSKRDPNSIIMIENGSFEWEFVENSTPESKKEKATKEKNDKKLSKNSKIAADTNDSVKEDQVGFKISDITLKVQTGSKTAIVGSVGCGKSSLLSALIGEMPKKGGSFYMNGSVAYCAQQPWILTDTILGNIVFNAELDLLKLNRVIKACALDADLELFPNGLSTEIGEKGVNLSGGQKARVALARALYKNPDIFLFDDPISALDAQVGRHVFDHAIKDYLAEKTVVLVTHQLHLLPEMDHIVVLDKGNLVESGSYKELMAKGAVLADLMKNYNIDEDNSDQKKATKAIVAQDPTEAKKGSLIVEEDRERGNVSFAVFWDYFEKAGGWAYVITFATAAILSSTVQVLNNVWLQWWTEPFNSRGYSKVTYMRVYGILGLIQFAFALIINTVFLAGAYRASKLYHNAALRRLMRAPMGFFDSQPIGRLLNRMSKDIESTDQNIWIILFLFTISLSGSLSYLVFLATVDPRLIALILPLCVIYFFLLKYYQRSNIELKRFESINKSPLYAHVSETLSGLSTVKAYGVQESFIERQRKLIDVSNIPMFLRLMCQIWVNLRLELLSSLLTLTLCLLGVSSAGNAGLIGLALTYAISFAKQLNLLLFSSSSLENEFNSVERLMVYCNDLPEEAALDNPKDTSPEQWPLYGAIEFKDICLAYPSRPDVQILKNLSFKVQPGEKIGVIGRTGSGKSTLMTALFRLVELEKGSIIIDDIDISHIGLHTLRKSIQIIPQEPVLFSGTLRENLDVESIYSDVDVWDILDRIGLKDYVSGLTDKLCSPVLENGENLSVGQRQLICLGRAILTKPRILIMDEATASVDSEADKLIQESIKTLFKNTTVLSIAHRLNTIANFDKVLVLQDGEKVEFAAPHALLSDSESLFFQLAAATGVSNLAVLQSVAKAKFDEQN